MSHRLRKLEPNPKLSGDRIQKNILDFIQGVLKDPIPASGFGYEAWRLPYKRPLRDHYYNILYNIAKLCGVKLMWRWLLDPEMLLPIKGLWVIGSFHRRQLFIHISNYVFGSIIPPKAKFSSQLVRYQLDNICKDIERLLEPSKRYDLWLENKVKFLFHLDYKDYKGVPKYYHAISKKFHHKRVLL